MDTKMFKLVMIVTVLFAGATGRAVCSSYSSITNAIGGNIYVQFSDGLVEGVVAGSPTYGSSNCNVNIGIKFSSVSVGNTKYTCVQVGSPVQLTSTQQECIDKAAIISKFSQTAFVLKKKLSGCLNTSATAGLYLGCPYGMRD
jgi:hypothetical protein